MPWDKPAASSFCTTACSDSPLASRRYAWVAAETKAEFLKGFFLTHNVGRFLGAMEGHSGGPADKPAAIRGGIQPIVSWVAQTFLQLVLLSIIMVGQNVQASAADKRAEDTYKDAEAVLHEAIQIQAHLEAQDAVLETLVDKLAPQAPATT